ncbi:MAG: hypothetical protein ACT4QF_14950 [Sporichthyaceae bacterium]
MARSAADLAAAGERHHRLAAALHTHEVAAEILERIDLDPAGVLDRRVPAGERLYFVVDGVSLLEPASTPDAPAILVEDGQLVVSNRALRFRSERAAAEWPFDRVVGQLDGRRCVTWALEDGGALDGVGGSRVAAVAARAGGLWGVGRIAEAREYLTSIVDQTRREIEAMRAELALAPKPKTAKLPA